MSFMKRDQENGIDQGEAQKTITDSNKIITNPIMHATTWQQCILNIHITIPGCMNPQA
jgi:hypothetical protein